MTSLNTVSVTLDFFSILICFVLIFCVYRSNIGQKSLRRLFIWMCLFNIGTLLGDIPNWLCEGLEKPWYPLALWGGCLLLYLCMMLLLLTYTHYVVCYLSPKVRVDRRFIWALGVIAAVYMVCLAVSQFNGMFYWIDAANVYHRGSWYFFSQALGVLILIIDTSIVLVYRSHLRQKEIAAFSGYIILPVAAVVIQFFFYGLSLCYTAATVALLVIFIDIQSEQALLVEQMEKKLLQARIAILIGQIQPHFLYNCLTTIANLCTSDGQLAKEKLISFARYLRGNMDVLSQEGLISFEEELEHTRFYLSMEKLRFEERLKIVYELESKDFMLPPLTLQPIVENAVRHGITKKIEGGTVRIASREAQDAWLVSVEDNGCGFDTGDPFLFDGISHVGINNVEQRLKSLCGGSLELYSKEGEGTRVVIRLPKEGREKI